MGSYVPNTPEERQEMLQAIGLHDFRELYGDVPASMYLDRPLDLPSGMSELEVRRTMTELAGENRVFSTILRGAGAYDHYIPSIVKYIPAKEEFLTANTPYQAELRPARPSPTLSTLSVPTATARATSCASSLPRTERPIRTPCESFWRPGTSPACASSSRTSSASLRTPKRSARSSMQRARCISSAVTPLPSAS